MAFTVKYLGHDVICDSPEDVRALLNQNGTQPKPAAGVHHALFGDASTSGAAGFVAKLDGKPRELLRLIAVGGIVPRDQLLQSLGVTDPHEFGGFLITLHKRAASAGIDTPVERSMVRMNGNGERKYHYKIRDDIKADVKAALGA
jgi:hypothetical protein